MVTPVKQCPRCGRYCTPYIITSWMTEWKCTCGYSSAVDGAGIVYAYTTAGTVYNGQALTDSRTTINDQHSRQIQKEGGVPSLKA